MSVIFIIIINVAIMYYNRYDTSTQQERDAAYAKLLKDGNYELLKAVEWWIEEWKAQ